MISCSFQSWRNWNRITSFSWIVKLKQSWRHYETHFIDDYDWRWKRPKCLTLWYFWKSRVAKRVHLAAYLLLINTFGYAGDELVLRDSFKLSKLVQFFLSSWDKICLRLNFSTPNETNWAENYKSWHDVTLFNDLRRYNLVAGVVFSSKWTLFKFSVLWVHWRKS